MLRAARGSAGRMGNVALKSGIQKQGPLDTEALLQMYQADRSIELRNQLALRYASVAESVAASLYTTYYRFANPTDIVNQGMIAILESLEKYDFDSEVNLTAYLFTKVRSAIIDYVRKQDYLPRRMRRNEIQIAEAQNKLAMTLGRYPTKKEIAAHLGISFEELLKRMAELAGDYAANADSDLLSQQQLETCDVADEDDPIALLDTSELRRDLARAVDSLQGQERTVISLYYYEHLKLREIGEIMGVSEQRICLIKKSAVQHLRAALNDYRKG